MNNDREQLRVLSILHFVWAAVVAFGLCLGGLWAAIASVAVKHGLQEAARRGEQPPPKELFDLLGLLWILVMLVVLAYLLCVVIAAISLGLRRNRTFCMVVAALSCLSFPLGTTLGVFTLIVLSRDSVRQLYCGAPQPA